MKSTDHMHHCSSNFSALRLTLKTKKDKEAGTNKNEQMNQETGELTNNNNE